MCILNVCILTSYNSNAPGTWMILVISHPNLHSLPPCLSVIFHSNCETPGCLHQPYIYLTIISSRHVGWLCNEPTHLWDTTSTTRGDFLCAGFCLWSHSSAPELLRQHPFLQPLQRDRFIQLHSSFKICILSRSLDFLNDFLNLCTLKFTLPNVKFYEFWQTCSITCYTLIENSFKA